MGRWFSLIRSPFTHPSIGIAPRKCWHVWPVLVLEPLPADAALLLASSPQQLQLNVLNFTWSPSRLWRQWVMSRNLGSFGHYAVGQYWCLSASGSAQNHYSCSIHPLSLRWVFVFVSSLHRLEEELSFFWLSGEKIIQNKWFSFPLCPSCFVLGHAPGIRTLPSPPLMTGRVHKPKRGVAPLEVYDHIAAAQVWGEHLDRVWGAKPCRVWFYKSDQKRNDQNVCGGSSNTSEDGYSGIECRWVSCSPYIP